ncbi:MAG: M23 family metallopeptidase, partial [Saprospiraceae bacterium]
ADWLAQHIHHEPLREELLDHLCCEIETLLATDLTFSQASQLVFSAFAPPYLRQLEQETLQHSSTKFSIMKKLLTAAVLCAAFGFSMWTLQADSTTKVPLDVPLITSNNLQTIEIPEDSLTMVMPIQGKDDLQTSGFGFRHNPFNKKRQFHRGIDLRAKMGTTVVAAAAGKVIEVKNDKKGYGKRVILQHANDLQTSYAHLSAFKVVVGQEVQAGEIIALSGNSGLSTAPHLHFEVIRKGKAVNPAEYIAMR